MESLLWDEIFGVQGKMPFWTPARKLDKWDKDWTSFLRVETHPGLSHPSPKGKTPGMINTHYILLFRCPSPLWAPTHSVTNLRSTVFLPLSKKLWSRQILALRQTISCCLSPLDLLLHIFIFLEQTCYVNLLNFSVIQIYWIWPIRARVKGPQNQIQASSGKTQSWPLGQLKFEAIQI